MINPTPLSPAARAVWEAFNQFFDEAGMHVDYGVKLAAALRAAADQGESLYDPHEGKVSVVRVEHLRAIAAELDGTSALEPNDLSHLSEEEFQSLAPQGYHAP